MKTRRDHLRKIETILVLWAVFAVLAYFLQKATADWSFDYRFITEPRYGERFRAVLALLPPGAKLDVIFDPPGSSDKELYAQRQRWTRYLLTPYLGHGEYVISDFHQPMDLNKLADERQLVLVKNFKTREDTRVRS